MFKFLHAADIHLDSPQRGLDRYEGAPVGECRGATRKALENLVGLAVGEGVAFVLIAGDLYDGDWPDYNTGLFFGAQMARLRDAGIRVVLVRGNHDAQNRMTRDLRLLDNTSVLSDRSPQTLRFDDIDVAIHGQSFASQAVKENLSLAYPGADRGRFNIGMLHTSVTGNNPDHETYAPCKLDDLRSRGYDYWALGHIHTRAFVHRDDPVIAFPGNIQGRHVREPDAKGCLLVTVDGGHRVASAEFRPLDVVRWAVCKVDATDAADGDEVLERFRRRLILLQPGADDRLLSVRVELSGPCRAHAALSADWPRWATEFRQTATEAGGGRVWVEKVLPKTRPEAAPDASAEGPLAELSALLDELRSDASALREFLDRELLDDLRRKLDPDLLADLDPRSLLDQVGPLLLDRLTGGSG